MKLNVKKKRVCFWLPIQVHGHLKDLSNDGKALFGKKYGMGDVITDFACNAEPELKHLLEVEENLSNV